MAMEALILVVNSGSSSIKFSGYTAMDRRDPALLFKGQVEGIGSAPHQSLTCIKAQSGFADSFSTAHSRPTFAHLAPS
jgi:acetate kinase